MAINLYEVLNIKPTASIKEIEAAIADAEQSSVDPAMINAAKQFLLDEEKRKKYDLMLAKGGQNNSPIQKNGYNSSARKEKAYKVSFTLTKEIIIALVSVLFIGFFIGFLVGKYSTQSQSKPEEAVLNTNPPQEINSVSEEKEAPQKEAVISAESDTTTPSELDLNIAKVRLSLNGVLKDPDSAKIDIIHKSTDVEVTITKIQKAPFYTDIICGEINAKNSYGAYSGSEPFVWASFSNKVYLHSGEGSFEEPISYKVGDFIFRDLMKKCLSDAKNR